MICIKCGHVGESTFCGRCGADLRFAQVPKEGNALTWPFYQPGWYKTLWMPLAWFILPGLGTLLSFGWSIDAIGRRARGESVLIPQIRDIATFFKHGLVVFTMGIIYFVVPVGFFLLLTEMSFIGTLSQLWSLIVAIWHGQPQQSVSAFLWQKFIALITHSEIPGIYIPLALPMFFVARLRYATTNRLSSFVRLFANATFCLRHVGQILLYLFLATVIRGSLGVLSGSVIGLIIPVVLGGASVWVLAYLAGQLACEISPTRQAKVRQTGLAQRVAGS